MRPAPHVTDWSNMHVKGVYTFRYIDGLKAFAYWKDGEEFVGTSGMTLREAITNRDKLWNFKFPTEEGNGKQNTGGEPTIKKEIEP